MAIASIKKQNLKRDIITSFDGGFCHFAEALRGGMAVEYEPVEQAVAPEQLEKAGLMGRCFYKVVSWNCKY